MNLKKNRQKWIIKLFKFLLVGLPAFILALPLNYYLVEKANIPIPVGYIIVLCMQVTINFFLCRRFVFDPHPDKTLFRQFWQFFSGIIVFRIADWALYTLLTGAFDLYYMGVQMANIFLFAIIKFQYSSMVMEQRKNNEG